MPRCAGRLEPGNPADCLVMGAQLVAADRLYTMKRQIVEELGFSEPLQSPRWRAWQHASGGPPAPLCPPSLT